MPLTAFCAKIPLHLEGSGDPQQPIGGLIPLSTLSLIDTTVEAARDASFSAIHAGDFHNPTVDVQLFHGTLGTHPRREKRDFGYAQTGFWVRFSSYIL